MTITPSPRTPEDRIRNLSPGPIPEASGDAEASAWLRSQLASGPQPIGVILAAADTAGVTRLALGRAKRDLGVIGTQLGAETLWSLPDGAKGGGCFPSESPDEPARGQSRSDVRRCATCNDPAELHDHRGCGKCRRTGQDCPVTADALQPPKPWGFAADPIPLPNRIDLTGLLSTPPAEPERHYSGLFYRGGLHCLFGPSESGKSTIALDVAARELAAGQPVLIIDEEGCLDVFRERMIALGVDPSAESLIHYYDNPSLTWGDAHIAGLREVLDVVQPTVVLFDSLGGLLGGAGLDENLNADVGRLYKTLLLPLPDYTRRRYPPGASVITIDHVNKFSAHNPTAPGSAAPTGAYSKARYSDVMIHVACVQPWSRYQSGSAALQVVKDRRGRIAPKRYEAAVTVDPESGRVQIAVCADPASEQPQLRDAEAQVLNILKDAYPEPRARQQIVQAVGRAEGTVSRALAKLRGAKLVDRVGNGKWVAVLDEDD